MAKGNFKDKMQHKKELSDETNAFLESWPPIDDIDIDAIANESKLLRDNDTQNSNLLSYKEDSIEVSETETSLEDSLLPKNEKNSKKTNSKNNTKVGKYVRIDKNLDSALFLLAANDKSITQAEHVNRAIREYLIRVCSNGSIPEVMTTIIRNWLDEAE